ncbi:DUF6415 family natural product biosynthesis protein [Streptomyces canus]|uniref:DUF6415 family natural product biosynthesis protein n=1 Tax=Streptomyces canus TaxID=58343 RepID=UPI0036A0C2D8
MKPHPPDIATMRDVIDRLLDPDALAAGAFPPASSDLEMLTLQLRGHVALMLPEVRQAAERLPRESIPRYCALISVVEARERLRAEPTRRYGGPPGYARRLARTLNALCNHWEALTRVSTSHS